MSGSRKMKWLRGSVFVVVVFGVGAAVFEGFLEGQSERALEAQQDTPIKAPLRVSVVDGVTTVTLDADAQKWSGIETVRLQSEVRGAEIQAYGAVLDLQPLTDLSNSYSATKAQLQTAQAKLNASRLAFERAQRLFQDQQNISAAQLQSAEAAFRVDEASVAAAEAQIQNVASSALQQWGSVLGNALVERAPLLLRLLQRQDVLIQVTLPPGESLAVPPPTAVAQSANAIRATIQYVSPAPRTDPRIQGVSFYYSASANSGLLPGMNVVVALQSGKAQNDWRIPASAVVWSEGRAWAYFRTAEQSFVRREIATDMPAPDGGYIVTTLPQNLDIVTTGAQLLLSEEFRSQIQVGEEEQ